MAQQHLIVCPAKAAVAPEHHVAHVPDAAPGREIRVLKGDVTGEQGVEPPFVESNEAFAKRVCEGFIKIIDGLIKTETDRAAIVTHGGVMMALLTNFGLPQLPMHEWITPNGCGYTLRVTPSLWMRGHKLEVVYEFPYEKNDEDGEEE